MKSYSELVEVKACEQFTAFAKAPYLVGNITNGIPVAFATFLRREMVKDPKQEVSLKIGDIMELTLKASKRGESIAFLPGFTILEKGLELVAKDKLEIEEDDMEALAAELCKNEDLLECISKVFTHHLYDDVKDEWIKNEKAKDVEGLNIYDPVGTDITVCAVYCISTILEVLANNKDASSDVEYEVPGFGTFKISSIKEGWKVALSYCKEYKANCKSDKAIEKIAELNFDE